MELQKFKKKVSIQIKLHVEHRLRSFDDIQSIQSILDDADLQDLEKCSIEVIASYREMRESNWREASDYRNEPDFTQCQYFKQQKIESIRMLHERIEKLFREW